MDVRKIVLLVGALVIAAVTAIMAKNMFAGPARRRRPPRPRFQPAPKVLVARKALPVGTIIDAESLRFQPWPEGTRPERLLHRRRAGRRLAEAARHGRPLPSHRRPAAHPRRAGRPERSRLPRRGAWARACAPSPFPSTRRPAASPASSSRATGSTWS